MKAVPVSEIERFNTPISASVDTEGSHDAGRDLSLFGDEVDECLLVDVPEQESLTRCNDPARHAVPARHTVTERDRGSLTGGRDEDELAAPVVQQHDRGLLGSEELDRGSHHGLDGVG